jgi:DNA (cytosine-5)-methyltransferase 1
VSKELKVLELFAGVGGFRVGFEASHPEFYKTKWANQFEPGKKAQDAFEVYDYHFSDSENINKSIAEITDKEFKKMDADLIVGGFPCQDYSVARSLTNETGITGKKGVLFWEITRAVSNIKPKYLVLENVDRLLKSPSTQRGRDFAIMLSEFNKLNYSVEWRVINAADYGCAQRRRRVFIFVYRNDTEFAKKINKQFNDTAKSKKAFQADKYDEYIFKEGLFASQFPVKETAVKNRHAAYELDDDMVEISDNFSGKVWNSGVMRFGKYYTIDTEPVGDESPIPLAEIIQSKEEIDEKYYISDKEKIEKFQYLRAAKKIPKVTKEGHEWIYAEGGMSPVDELHLPGRTMLTSEGSINRSTHFLKTDGRYRILTPIEAEQLQSFPKDWTKVKKTRDGKEVEVSDRMRMFFMGNALVTQIVKRIGDELYSIENG